MALDQTKSDLTTKELESWLSQVFIPVEPSEIFVHRLKTRLLKYQGNRIFSIWMVLGVFAMTLVLILTWLGFIMRIVLVFAGLFGMVDRRLRNRRETPIPVAGG